MPIQAAFEEKQYEYAISAEIAAGSTAVFPSGQVFPESRWCS